VALLGDEIIGVNHSFPIKIKIEEEIIMGSFGSDLAVHPKHRGKGISRELQRMKRQLKDRTAMFSLYVSSNPIVVERRDETRIPPFPHLLENLVRVKDINKHLKIAPEKNDWLIKIGFKTLNSLNILKKNIALLQSRNGGTHTRLEKIKSLDDRIDVFWDKIKEHYSFILERNKTYLDWRYIDNRSGEYTIILAKDLKNEIIGYIVTAINRKNKNYPIGYIMDILALPEKDEVVDKLITNAIEDFDREGINLVNALMFKDHPFKKLFLKNSFLNSRRKIHLFAGIKFDKEINRKIESLNPKRIHFTYGDIDSLPSI
jgi:hypothetical protein